VIESPVPTRPEGRRIPELDGLRGMAIAMVLAWHYGVNLVVPTNGWLLFLKQGLTMLSTGVDLFFVLSGFLLGGILLDHWDAPNYYRTFYVRRAWRILPLYYTIVLLFVLGAHSGWETRFPALAWVFSDPLPLASYETFTQNLVMAKLGRFGAYGLAVTWSLAIEEQFYLLLPLLLRWVPRTDLVRTLAGLVLLAVGLRLFCLDAFPQGPFIAFLQMPCRADSLFLGVMAACLWRNPFIKEWLTQRRRHVAALTLLLLAGAVAWGFLSRRTGWYVLTSVGFTWLAVLYVSLVFLALTGPRHLVGSVARHPALRWLGRVSFAVYLLHQPLNGLAHAVLLNQMPQMTSAAGALATLTALAGTLLLAWASWHALEKRLIARGHATNYLAPGSASG
jgi:peptidoglycan/LPS O-acetylase OafA/YrhL